MIEPSKTPSVGPCLIFDGEHANYHPWKMEAMAWLQTSSNACRQMMGNRGAFEAPAAFLIAPRPPGIVAAPFAARPNPGPRPVLPLPAPNAAIVAVHSDLMAQWREDLTLFIEQEKTSRTCINMLIKAVPEHYIIFLEGPVLKYQNVTLAQI